MKKKFHLKCGTCGCFRLFQCSNNNRNYSSSSSSSSPSPILLQETIDAHKKLVQSLAQHLQINKVEDWYQQDDVQIVKAAESIGQKKKLESILHLYYQRKMIHLLKTIYPDFAWDSMKFKTARKNSFSNYENRRRLFELIETDLKINSPEDWYQITSKQIMTLIKNKSSSQASPASPSAASREATAAGGTAASGGDSNAILYRKFHSMFQNYYKFNLFQLVKDMYPHFNELDKLKFKHSFRKESAHQLASSSTTSSTGIEYQRSILRLVEADLQLRSSKDWAAVTQEMATAAAERAGVLDEFLAILNKSYHGKFNRMKRRLFEVKVVSLQDMEYQQHILKLIGDQLKLRTAEDWYEVTRKTATAAASKIGIASNFKSILMLYYQGSFSLMLRTLLDLNDVFRFKRVTNLTLRGFSWPLQSSHQLPESKRPPIEELVKQMQEKLYIQKMEDWLSVSLAQLNRVAKFKTLQKMGGLWSILKYMYDQQRIDRAQMKRQHLPFLHSKKSQQQLLYRMIQQMFGDVATPPSSSAEAAASVADASTSAPSSVEAAAAAAAQVEVLQEYVMDEEKQYRFDVYIPSHKIALEYNGEQHYHQMEVFNNYRETQLRDYEKQKMSKQRNITLIVIPYFWNSSKETVASLICWKRPELLSTLRLSENELATVQQTISRYQHELDRMKATSQMEPFIVSASNYDLAMFIMNDAELSSSLNIVMPKTQHVIPKKPKQLTAVNASFATSPSSSSPEVSLNVTTAAQPKNI